MLPNTYLECEYIESFGNEYIETIQNKWLNKAHFNFTFIPKNVSTYQVLFGNQNEWNSTLLRIQNTGKLNLFFNNATINNNWDIDTLVINTKYNVDISLSTTGLIIKLNGVEKVNVSGNFQMNTSLTDNTNYIFCEHTQMSGYAEQRCFATCQLVNAYCEIDDVEKFNYLSCIRKSDSVVGLYDLVNDTFYTNQGSGEFGFRIKDKDINGFVNLDYIENHRLEYINTGITNVNNLRVDCDFTPTWLYGDTCVIGMRDGALGRRYFLNEYGNMLAVSNGGAFKTTSFNFVNNTRYKTSVSMKPNGVVAKVNDNVVFEESGINEGETTYPLYIFACNYGNSAVYILNINRIHSVYMMTDDSGEMLRIYQPKLRLSDMQSGLYDIINDVFYTNQGQGEFSYKVKELKMNNDIYVKVGNEVKRVKKVI